MGESCLVDPGLCRGSLLALTKLALQSANGSRVARKLGTREYILAHILVILGETGASAHTAWVWILDLHNGLGALVTSRPCFPLECPT